MSKFWKDSKEFIKFRLAILNIYFLVVFIPFLAVPFLSELLLSIMLFWDGMFWLYFDCSDIPEER